MIAESSGRPENPVSAKVHVSIQLSWLRPETIYVHGFSRFGIVSEILPPSNSEQFITVPRVAIIVRFSCTSLQLELQIVIYVRIWPMYALTVISYTEGSNY